jgi:hypothetical protein
VNAPSTEVRAAVATEFARSSPRRISACSSELSSVASASATKASPARTMSSASLTLANTGAVPIGVTSFRSAEQGRFQAVSFSFNPEARGTGKSPDS